MKSKAIKMNCLGDSITFGYHNSNGEPMKKTYPTILQEKLGFSIVRNYGINGSTIADGENPMYLRYKDMNEDADIISVLGGTNDFGRTLIEVSPLGKINDHTGKTVYGALNILCNGLKKQYPNAIIFFMTPLRCGKDTIPNKHGYCLKDVKIAIEEVCKKYSIPVLDLYTIGGFKPNDTNFLKQYGVDDWHPNQQFILEILTPILVSYIKKLMSSMED